ncbi:MAG: UDP-N-acetylmuramate--L-alanine ligase [Spirochaetales bacterium]|nr:UDP-N-acetylmuramate--L-alanine ligase [Spirochaetales bacterium]
MMQNIINNPVDKTFYFIGIKGTGMAALAELLLKNGAKVLGSDVDEIFYTDKVLNQLGIPYFNGFNEENIPDSVDLIIRSAAYTSENNCEVKFLEEKGQLPILYTDALAMFSQGRISAGIAGVHGKTTTTSIAGSVCANIGLEASVLAGSAVKAFGNCSTLVKGKKFFIAETCEYRRHFLAFNLDVALVTSIEPDHLDYFKDYSDILSAFIELGQKINQGGYYIYCEDDDGARESAEILRSKREDLTFLSYGFNATADYPLTNYHYRGGYAIFTFAGKEFSLKVPGSHIALDAAGAVLLNFCLYTFGKKSNLSDDPEFLQKAVEGVLEFAGSKRRSEIIGEVNNILFIDDYGHHPTAIFQTLKGYKEFYHGRRIVVDFMSHTYSRTRALLDEFASCFDYADIVVLNKIYASAREGRGEGLDYEFFQKTREHHPEVYYEQEFVDAQELLKKILQPEDVFITMGAGDNWVIGPHLMEYFKEQEEIV